MVQFFYFFDLFFHTLTKCVVWMQQIYNDCYTVCASLLLNDESLLAPEGRPMKNLDDESCIKKKKLDYVELRAD